MLDAAVSAGQLCLHLLLLARLEDTLGRDELTQGLGLAGHGGAVAFGHCRLVRVRVRVWVWVGGGGQDQGRVKARVGGRFKVRVTFSCSMSPWIFWKLHHGVRRSPAA